MPVVFIQTFFYILHIVRLIILIIFQVLGCCNFILFLISTLVFNTVIHQSCPPSQISFCSDLLTLSMHWNGRFAFWCGEFCDIETLKIFLTFGIKRHWKEGLQYSLFFKLFAVYGVCNIYFCIYNSKILKFRNKNACFDSTYIVFSMTQRRIAWLLYWDNNYACETFIIFIIVPGK